MRKVIWLPEGLAEDPHLRGTITGHYVAWGTGGHTDRVRALRRRARGAAGPGPRMRTIVAAHPVARLTRQRMAALPRPILTRARATPTAVALRRAEGADAAADPAPRQVLSIPFVVVCLTF
ncbi:MAG: hypothetical protein MZW92_54965 [Comamonadaceae bacterium]|nr:hypothetical protein [Comamonadaceae bacterium]